LKYLVFRYRKSIMKNIRFAFIISLLLLIFIQTLFSQKPGWTHFYIDAVLPGSSYGTSGPVVFDVDHDGDLDAILSRRPTREAYWYEQENDSVWIPHVIGSMGILSNSLGSAAIDINSDGYKDVAFEGIWFKNPGNLDRNPDALWNAYSYRGAGHDIISWDVNGDGAEDLVAFDGNKLSWFNPSKDMKETIISSGYDYHGGIAPKGIGDLDRDGDADMVIPGYWFENPMSETGNWKRHEWPFNPVPNASYGNSIRAWIADINNDDRNDIIYGHCDTGGSHVYWVENTDNGKNWISHQLQDPPVKPGDVQGTGSFHSLGVADFDLDGNPDIFAGEQEDPDTYMESTGRVAMKPRGLKERGIIWYNTGGEKPGFSIFVIHVDNPGWHDAQVVDVDQDGDIDIVSKVWNADSPVYHFDYWRNELNKK